MLLNEKLQLVTCPYITRETFSLPNESTLLFRNHRRVFNWIGSKEAHINSGLAWAGPLLFGPVAWNLLVIRQNHKDIDDFASCSDPTWHVSNMAVLEYFDGTNQRKCQTASWDFNTIIKLTHNSFVFQIHRRRCSSYSCLIGSMAESQAKCKNLINSWLLNPVLQTLVKDN